MRVAIMLSGLAMGGAERNIVSVAPYLKEAGVELHLVTLNSRRDSTLADEFKRTGIERHDLGARRMLDLGAWKRFLRVLDEEQIELVHAEDQDTIFYAALAHRKLKIPAVMTRHVLYEPTDTIKETIRARLVLLAARSSFNKIIAVSDAAGHAFAEKAKLSSEKIVTIYNGLPFEDFVVQEPREKLRFFYGWDEQTRVVVMVAALRRGKGHEVLFEAVPRVLEHVPDTRFVLVGDGEIAQQIKKLARPLGDSVEFLGQRSDMAEILAASDILTLPSWAEALPTVLIEAGAAALPVVATDVGGAAEITINDQTGYIVAPGDAKCLAERIITLLTDRERAYQMGRAARERTMQLFSLKAQAEQTVSLYNDILGQ